MRLQAFELQSEGVDYNRKDDPGHFLMARGATKEEAAFLVSGQHPEGRWVGQRVELNAMTSDGFIRWLERKLEAHGVTKFIPDEKHLQAAWARAWRIQKLNEAIATAVGELGEPPEVPPDPKDQVQRYLKQNLSAAWDMILTASEVQS